MDEDTEAQRGVGSYLRLPSLYGAKVGFELGAESPCFWPDIWGVPGVASVERLQVSAELCPPTLLQIPGPTPTGLLCFLEVHLLRGQLDLGFVFPVAVTTPSHPLTVVSGSLAAGPESVGPPCRLHR